MGYGKILWPIDIEGMEIELWEDGVKVYDGEPHESGKIGYFVDKGAAFSPKYGELLERLEALFNAAGANTYEFQVSPSSFKRDDYKIKLVRISGVVEFELRGSGGNEAFHTILGADGGSDVSSASGEIVFPLPYKGSWLLGHAWQYHNSRSYPQMVGGVVTTSDDSVHIKARNRKNFRQFKFIAVPGVLAFDSRVRFPCLVSDVAGVEFGDANISFETFWRECISQGKQFRYYQNSDPTVLEQTNVGRSQVRVTDPSTIMNPITAVQDRYKEFGRDHVDISFSAKILLDIPRNEVVVVAGNALVNNAGDPLVDDAGNNIVFG